MLALKVNGPVERGRFDEPEIAGRDTAVAPVSHYFPGLRWEWFIPRRIRGGRTFFPRFPFSNFAFDLVCATFWRVVFFFFFFLIYRGKFKGDRTEVRLFVYLIYTLSGSHVVMYSFV